MCERPYVRSVCTISELLPGRRFLGGDGGQLATLTAVNHGL